jgi:3'-5' exoribonuclease
MKQPLDALFDKISDLCLFKACLEIPATSAFHSWPAAISMHHAYEGGLLAHTIEVTEIALHIADRFPHVNRDVLIAAALWHDYGKILEYRLVDPYAHVNPADGDYAEFDTAKSWVRDSNAMSHLLSSAMQFHQAALTHSVDRATRDAVIHCIHAHHGPVKEWGSPEAPRTIEALILHQADMLSSHYGATKEKP